MLIAQMIGSAAIVSATFATSMVMMLAINAFGILRVPEEGELQGLDIHEHGIPAYPEYALHPSAAPHGTAGFTAAAFSSSRAATEAARKR